MQKQGRINYLILLTLSILLSSCRENNQTEKLTQARSIINDKPKEALILLDSISDPETMDEKDYMQYIVTKTDAKLRIKQDVTNDTLIYKAQMYYNTKSDLQNCALVNYLSGDVSYDRDNYDKSLDSYLLAEYYARKTNNDLMIAKSLHSIGNLYYIQEKMDSAIVRYKNADLYYYKITDYDSSKLLINLQIGRTYENMNSFDSALVYYDKGFNLAKKLDNEQYQTRFTHSLGIVWREKGDYSQSEKYLKKALSETADETEALRIHLSLARLYIKLNKPDATQLHIQEIKNSLSKVKDNITLRGMYQSLTDFYKLNEDYKESQYYSDLKENVVQKISDEKGFEKLMNAEKQYRLSLQNQELESMQFRFRAMLGLSVGLVLALLIIILLQRRNNRLKREKENGILKQQLESLFFLKDIYQHIISDWVSIDKEVKKLAKEFGAKDEPELYKRIKQLISDIREKSNIRLLENAEAEILKLEHGVQILSLLTEQEQLILFLRQQRYDKKEISTIIGKGITHTHLMEIRRKLIQAGVQEKNINKLLFSIEQRT